MQPTNRPRKACDLCYTRKIKCDGQQPQCSNCVNYKTVCTHAARSRKWKPKAQQNVQRSDAEEIRSLQAQMQQLQVELAEYREQDKALVTPTPSQDMLISDEFIDAENSTNSMKLPPLQQTMHMTGIFLNTFNSMMPLFNPDSLLRLIGETYAVQPRQRNPVSWAAINVVLALACHQMPDDSEMNSECGIASDYIKKAQSVIWTVTLGETGILNIQTLIGMAMLLQTANDTTPALVIISAAMRLIHKMGLHNRLSTEHLSLIEQRQHAYVFWLAYIVDKDLSLRAQQPSVQLDDDIDLDLPMELPGVCNGDSEAGIVTTVDGNTGLNYLLARIQLANIQGNVYDHLYSTRASKRTPEERKISRERIVRALDDWKASIPSDFNGANVVTTTSNNPSVAAFFCILHTRSLLCLSLITRSHAWDEQWVGSIREYGRGTQALQLPSEWTAMVGEARNYMILYEQVHQRHSWLRWFAACTYMSAMVLLTANNLNDSQHADFAQDTDRIERALVWFQEHFKEKPCKMSAMLGDVCTEAVEAMKQRRANNVAGAVEDIWLTGFIGDKGAIW
ncbi:hypothetical protein FPSE_08793 [Fusarium pseudograminearum CS3096]|uniref:Zn(2)-C6 fungal-type domain-containing protein n=1 Tax=Fusarium pseudograminearum (strain CS3096) TaxID=1028729 RepID=K3VEF0_FUSPC|nr:hypothetical protein FPSE_08793 [Fusarium pseudograminearum CS3096]EKJ71008.1 hypothetical protein FPSE_08793 [Fusarium pseudograminearum CS3096]